MTTAALVLIWAASVPATLGTLVYGTAAQWYRSLFGWALFTSSTALALLLDLSLLFHYWRTVELDVAERIALVVYALVCLGAWLMCGAVVRRQLRHPGRRP